MGAKAPYFLEDTVSEPVDKIVDTTTELLKSLEGHQLKQHIILDSQGRIKYLFEAVINTQDGKPCLCTEYVYRNSTSTVVIKRQERQYLWKSAWETSAPAFEFDPSVDYDLDGDGEE